MNYIIEQVNDGPHAGMFCIVTYVFDQSSDVLRMPVVPELYLDNIGAALTVLNVCNGGTVDVEVVTMMQPALQRAQERLQVNGVGDDAQG